MKIKVAVIADDLTGANDTGVQFAKQGLDTVVLMGTSHFADIKEHDVLVIDTNSRAVSRDEAYRRAAQAAKLVKKGGYHTVYKKVDSTLRGNLGPEIDAIMDACGQKLAVVAPAFPKNGRVTVGGLHLLNTMPLEATEIARDPKMPVKESHIPTLLAGQTKRPVGHLGIKTVMQGQAAIAEELGRLAREGREVVVCDIWQEEQFKNVAAAIAKLAMPVLWVGSAGLAEYLPAVLGLESNQSAKAVKEPVVVIAGSVSGVTRNQVSKLTERTDMAYIQAVPYSFLSSDTTEVEVERCCEGAAAALASGQNVVIASGYSDDIVKITKEKALALGLDGQQTGDLVAVGLGQIGKRLALSHNLSGMVLTGGDIAVAVCAALQATGLKVSREVAPGIPVGELQGGFKDGLKVVTKAGAFGAEDALAKAVDCLRQ